MIIIRKHFRQERDGMSVVYNICCILAVVSTATIEL